MESLTAMFDVSAIKQSCWQTCDADPAAFPIEFAQLPTYTDEDTSRQFVNVGTFFGCVDLCEWKYEEKRIWFIIPATAGAFVILLTCLLCFLWPRCLCYRLCKKREKHRLMDSSSSLNLPPVTGTTKDPLSVTNTSSISSVASSSKPPFLTRKTNIQKSSRDSGYHLKHPQLDLDASMRSNVSVNSWINDSNSSSVDKRKSMFLTTATKLGRKLVDMDNGIDHKRRRKRRELQLAREEEARERTRRKFRQESGDKKAKKGSGKTNSSSASSSTGITQPRMRF